MALADGIRLGNYTAILPHESLPDFETAGVQAFAANYELDSDNSYMAYICRVNLPERRGLLQKIKMIANKSMLRVVDWGTILWTPDNTRRFAIICTRPYGQKLMVDGEISPDMKLREEAIIRRILKPFYHLLVEFSENNIFCGGIRPDNIYLASDKESPAVLGEFFTAPPSYHQPVIYETPERGQAQASGRGKGDLSDDLYALGMTCLILFLGHNPLASLDDDDVILKKLDIGTYPAFMGKTRLTGLLAEPIRGLLGDVKEGRWGLKDLGLWVDGRRLSPKLPDPPRRGARSFDFMGKELWNRRSLAWALALDVSEARKEISSQNVDKWLRRAVSESKISDYLSQMVESLSGRGSSISDEEYVAKCLTIIDPLAPIHYGDIHVMPEGIGTALAEVFLSGGDVEKFSGIFSKNLASRWYRMQTELKHEYARHIRQFEKMRSYLEHEELGQGIERVLYELNPFISCQSTGLKPYLVVEVEDFLPALEEVANSTNHAEELLDRHSTAFLVARIKSIDKSAVRALNNVNNPTQHMLGTLSILAGLQEKSSTKKLTGLCNWVLSITKPYIDALHNKEYREDLQRRLEKASSIGSLDEMRNIIDDRHMAAQDSAGHFQAQQYYKEIERRIGIMEYYINNPSMLAKLQGKAFATKITVMFAILAMIIILLAYNPGEKY